MVTPLKNGARDMDNQKILKVSHEKQMIEHTDGGMDKEAPSNSFNFCYARVEITEKFDFEYFTEGSTYLFDLDITARNIFGVEIKCRLSPWFRVCKKDKNHITFLATHNFEYYDSVRYVGGFNE